MPNGYNGVILRVDLSSGTIEKREFPEEFYRTYMGGGAVGAYFLLQETGGDLDAFDARNVLTIAPGVTTGCAVSGASRCSVVAISPLTGAAGEGQVGGNIGPFIKFAGYDAIVITGCARDASLLLIDGDTVEIRPAGLMTGRPVSEVYDVLHEELSEDEKRICILQCGPAGEKRVRFKRIKKQS